MIKFSLEFTNALQDYAYSKEWEHLDVTHKEAMIRGGAFGYHYGRIENSSECANARAAIIKARALIKNEPGISLNELFACLGNGLNE